MMEITRRKFLKLMTKSLLGGAVAAAGGVGGYQYGKRVEAEWLDIERIQIPLKNLSNALEGFKIVQLSDLHLYPFTELTLIQEAVAIVNTLAPDVVALTGDFVLREAAAIFDLAPVLAGLNPKYGIFASLGNHDLWTDESTVQRGFEEARIPLLKNAGRLLGVGSATLYIAGVDDAWSGRPDLRTALADAPPETPTILLAHEPDLVDTFSQEGQVSLQLSGHTHGGQVRLPGIGPLVLPPHGQKYDLGLYRVNDTWLYTNRGLGVIWPPVRFNCRPEITEITLVGG